MLPPNNLNLINQTLFPNLPSPVLCLKKEGRKGGKEKERGNKEETQHTKRSAEPVPGHQGLVEARRGLRDVLRKWAPLEGFPADRRSCRVWTAGLAFVGKSLKSMRFDGKEAGEALSHDPTLLAQGPRPLAL